MLTVEQMRQAINEPNTSAENLIQSRMAKHGETREEAEQFIARCYAALLPSAMRRAAQILRQIK